MITVDYRGRSARLHLLHDIKPNSDYKELSVSSPLKGGIFMNYATSLKKDAFKLYIQRFYNRPRETLLTC